MKLRCRAFWRDLDQQRTYLSTSTLDLGRRASGHPVFCSTTPPFFQSLAVNVSLWADVKKCRGLFVLGDSGRGATLAHAGRTQVMEKPVLVGVCLLTQRERERKTGLSLDVVSESSLKSNKDTGSGRIRRVRDRRRVTKVN